MGTVLRNILPITAQGRPANVRFDGRHITASGQASDISESRDEIIDCRARLACSGFINAHAHLPMVLFRGVGDAVPLRAWLKEHIWPIERRLQPEDVYWCTLLALAESIRGGTVGVADMYFHSDHVARAVEESGVRALLSYGIVADRLDGKGRDELAAGTALIERWEGKAEGRISVALSPHAVYTCGEPVWRAAIEAAGSMGAPIHTHLSESRDEVGESRERTGLSPVAFLDRIGAFGVPTLAAHCVHVDAEDIAILADREVSVAHCPKSNAKLGNGIAPVEAMRKAGVNVALGTDGAASNNRLDMVEELRAACLLQRASNEDAASVTASQSIAMASANGRAALGMPQADLRVGDVADIVLLEIDRPHTSPKHDPAAMLAFAATASDVTDVIVDGRYLLKNRELLTIDEDRVQSEVKRLLRRLNH